MILLIDVGSRWLKWALLHPGGTPGPSERVPYAPAEPAAWQGALATLAPPSRILVANAAGLGFAAAFADWARRHWRVAPQFPVASAAALGVRNACQNPGELAIDRWLGLLAAWRVTAAPLLVASARAAYAVDLVDGGGQHRCGWVVPGARLMREVLHAQTAGVATPERADAAVTDGVFGVNTAGGVQQGAHLALAALTDRLATAFERELGRAPQLYVTGGAGSEIAALMRRTPRQLPDLVLGGLALLATEGVA